MSSTARKLNFLIEDEICREMERIVPTGKRSRVVNDALRKELELLRRKSAVEQLLASSSLAGGYSHIDILEFIAEDRTSHK